MVSYSIDLRQKILHACERRLGSQQAIAHIFGVSLSYVEKLLRRYRTTGELTPKPHGGGPRAVLRSRRAANLSFQACIHWHLD
jgi:transposase